MGGIFLGTFLKLEMTISQKRVFHLSIPGKKKKRKKKRLLPSSMMMCCSRAQNSTDKECAKGGELSKRAETRQRFAFHDAVVRLSR